MEKFMLKMNLRNSGDSLQELEAVNLAAAKKKATGIIKKIALTHYDGWQGEGTWAITNFVQNVFAEGSPQIIAQGKIESRQWPVGRSRLKNWIKTSKIDVGVYWQKDKAIAARLALLKNAGFIQIPGKLARRYEKFGITVGRFVVDWNHSGGWNTPQMEYWIDGNDPSVLFVKKN